MSIVKELEELTAANVISAETAENIRAHFRNRQQHSGNRLFIAFGILGAILTGLGIILIIAHNWDDLSKNTKVFFSFMPLILAQVFCAYTLLKQNDSLTWREGSSAFLFFAVGACISLISQIYNIHGTLDSFLFTWLLLCIPIVYIMRSSIAALLYIAGVSYYCLTVNDFVRIFNSKPVELNYWWMLALVLPFYFMRMKNQKSGNFSSFLHWFLALSLTICLGSLSHHYGRLMYLAYASLFALFYLVGSSQHFKSLKLFSNAWLVLGTLGTTNLLLTLSFRWYWEGISDTRYELTEVFPGSESIGLLITTLAAIAALIIFHSKQFTPQQPVKYIFLVLILLYFVTGNYAPIAVTIVNLIILACGILTIWNGAKNDHLGILNYGLLTITALILCRFFDSDMSFVLRGLLFIAVGAGFFTANYLMLKKRKQLALSNINTN